MRTMARARIAYRLPVERPVATCWMNWSMRFDLLTRTKLTRTRPGSSHSRSCGKCPYYDGLRQDGEAEIRQKTDKERLAMTWPAPGGPTRPPDCQEKGQARARG